MSQNPNQIRNRQGQPPPGQPGKPGQPVRAGQQARPAAAQGGQPPQPRTFDFSSFDMPWAVTKAGFKFHSGISQSNQAVFYFGRVLTTFFVGVPLYGSIAGYTGIKTAEDLTLWSCDTMHPGCDIVCYNRFLPIMPARLLQFQVYYNYNSLPLTVQHSATDNNVSRRVIPSLFC